MSLKLKVVLGVLLLLAVGVVVRIGTLVAGKFDISASLRSGTAVIGKPAQVSAAYVDSDADGLLDTRESRYRTDPFKSDTDEDGYVDGEEVVSGHDPAKKENDSISKNTNVTDLFAQRLIACIYAGD